MKTHIHLSLRADPMVFEDESILGWFPRGVRSTKTHQFFVAFFVSLLHLDLNVYLKTYPFSCVKLLVPKNKLSYGFFLNFILGFEIIL